MFIWIKMHEYNRKHYKSSVSTVPEGIIVRNRLKVVLLFFRTNARIDWLRNERMKTETAVKSWQKIWVIRIQIQHDRQNKMLFRLASISRFYDWRCCVNGACCYEKQRKKNNTVRLANNSRAPISFGYSLLSHAFVSYPHFWVWRQLPVITHSNLLTVTSI